jgi:signal transduction histidine kinase/HAMP domain-containing protein
MSKTTKTSRVSSFSILDNMPLRNKFILIFLIPFAGMLFFSVASILEKKHIVGQMNDIQKLTKFAVHASSVVHEIQKERGMSAGFIGGQSKKFSKDLSNQSEQSDKKIELFQKFLRKTDHQQLLEHISEPLSNALKVLEQIAMIRESVSKMTISLSDTLQFYDDINNNLLESISHLSYLTPDTKLTSYTYAYAGHLQRKELASKERAILANAFAQDYMSVSMFIKFNIIVAGQDLLTKQFKTSILPDAFAIAQIKMNSPVVLESLRIRNIAFQGGAASRLYVLLGQLYQHMSLGGAYHSFKNLLLRGSDYGTNGNKPNLEMQERYKNQFVDNYQAIKGIIEQILALPVSELRMDQRLDVKIVWSNISAYHNNIDTIIKYQNEGRPLRYIDSDEKTGVKIDDLPAQQAIRRLMKSTFVGNFGVNPDHWFKTQSDKIDLLKNVEDWLIKTIELRTEKLENDAVFSLSFNLFLTVISLLASLYLAIGLISKYLTRRINQLVNATQNIANSDWSVRIEESGNDELGLLSATFNSMVEELGRLEEIKQAQTSSMQELTQRLKDAQNLVHMGNWVMNIAEGRAMWSEEIFQILDRPPQPNPDFEKLLEYMHQDDRNLVMKTVDKTLQYGGECEVEYRLVRPSGEIRHIHSIGRVTEWADGKPAKMAGALQDITTRKQLEIDLRQSKKMVEVADRAKSDFLANISHEIRTPMNAIIGMSHFLAKTPMSEKQQGYQSKIDLAAKKMLDVINSILDFSKIETGKLDLEHRDFVLADVLDKVTSIYKVQCLEKGLNFSFASSKEIHPFLVGDSLRLEQVLNNLLSNAVKFSENGEVSVKAELVEESEQEETIRFTISDTGIGMDQEQINQLFQAFYQADASSTRKFCGTGVGLVVSKRLVEMMGGEIHVSSEPGAGSQFFFTVQFGKSKKTIDQIEAESSKQVSTRSVHDYNALIGDDETKKQSETMSSAETSLKKQKKDDVGAEILEPLFKKAVEHLLVFDSAVEKEVKEIASLVSSEERLVRLNAIQDALNAYDFEACLKIFREWAEIENIYLEEQ